MDHIVHIAQRQIETILVAHIANEIADEGIFLDRKVLRHFELLEFVTAEDDQTARLVLRNDGLEKMLAEGTRAAGHQNGFVVEIEPGLGKIAQPWGGRPARLG